MIRALVLAVAAVLALASSAAASPSCHTLREIRASYSGHPHYHLVGGQHCWYVRGHEAKRHRHVVARAIISAPSLEDKKIIAPPPVAITAPLEPDLANGDPTWRETVASGDVIRDWFDDDPPPSPKMRVGEAFNVISLTYEVVPAPTVLAFAPYSTWRERRRE